jgi:hypothetical protein
MTVALAPRSIGRWATLALVIAVGIVIPSFQPLDDLHLVRFRCAAITAVLVVVAVSEWMVPSLGDGRTWRVLFAGATRGSCAGCCMWIMITWLASCWADRGDKFPLFVVYYAPAPTVAGLVAGALSSWCRGKLKPSRLP